MSKARIGVIGTGWWSTYAHIPALIAHSEAELVALADSDSQKLNCAGDHYQVAQRYTDFREMLAGETLDGVIVAVWHAAHFEVASACLEHGLHMVLEKPMVLRATHARTLVQMARDRDREIIMGYPWNFLNQTRRARDVVAAGGIGEIHFVADTFASAPYGLFKGEDPSGDPALSAIFPVMGPGDVYTDPARSGGGQGHLQVTHSAALMFFITGLKAVSVQARMSNLDTPVDVVDTAMVELDNGALATVGSTGRTVGGQGKLDVQIYGDKGCIDLDYITNTGSIRYGDGSEEAFETGVGADLQGDNPGGDYLYPAHAPSSNLVDVILGRGENMSPPEAGWRVVEMLEAAYLSAQSDGVAVDVASLYK